MVRLFLVESESSVGRGLRLLLDAEFDFDVVGEAVDCASALVALPAANPDVVIIDIDCPHFTWLASTDALARIAGQTSIVFLTLRDSSLVDRLAECLGGAVVAKAAPAQTLLNAIRHAARKA